MIGELVFFQLVKQSFQIGKRAEISNDYKPFQLLLNINWTEGFPGLKSGGDFFSLVLHR